HGVPQVHATILFPTWEAWQRRPRGTSLSLTNAIALCTVSIRRQGVPRSFLALGQGRMKRGFRPSLQTAPTEVSSFTMWETAGYLNTTPLACLDALAPSLAPFRI